MSSKYMSTNKGFLTLLPSIRLLSSEFFHVCEVNEDDCRLFHTADIHRFSLLVLFLFVFEDNFDLQRLYHADYIHRVSLQCEFVHACERS